MMPKQRKKFKVTFIDIIEAPTEKEAYDQMSQFCFEVAKSRDVTAFAFEELTEPHTPSDYV